MRCCLHGYWMHMRMALRMFSYESAHVCAAQQLCNMTCTTPAPCTVCELVDTSFATLQVFNAALLSREASLAPEPVRPYDGHSVMQAKSRALLQKSCNLCVLLPCTCFHGVTASGHFSKRHTHISISMPFHNVTSCSMKKFPCSPLTSYSNN